LVNGQESGALAILKRGFKKSFWLAVFVCATVMNLACIKSQNHIGSESFFLKKASGKNRISKAETFPSMSRTRQEDLSAPAHEKMPSQPTDFGSSKTTSHNTEKLEEQFPEVSDALLKVKKDPANPENHFRLAQRYHLCKVYDLALEEYQWASQLDPDNPAYYESLGRLWRDSGAFQNGIVTVQKALHLDKDNVESWNTLGTIYDCMGDHGQAQQAYSKAISINPSLDYLHNNLCSSFLETGEYIKAVPHCRQAVQLNPGLFVAQNNLGIVYGMLGDSSKAYEAFLRAGDEASAHNNLGCVLLQKSDLKAASEEFRQAAKLRPNYRIASKNYYLTKGLIFKRDGRTAGKCDGDSQSQPMNDAGVSGSGQFPIALLDCLKLNLNVLRTALDHQYIISLLCRSEEELKTSEVSSDMDSRIVVGDQFLKRQAILTRN